MCKIINKEIPSRDRKGREEQKILDFKASEKQFFVARKKKLMTKLYFFLFPDSKLNVDVAPLVAKSQQQRSNQSINPSSVG